MNFMEALSFLGKWSREELKIAIEDGVALPVSTKTIRLCATKLERDYDISEADLDAFFAVFDAEQPGRHPPTEIRRALLVEARHRCAICEDAAPLEFHHILEWNRIKHYDVRHMLAVCGSCHSRCGNGTIDRQAQLRYKQNLDRLSVGPMFLTAKDATTRFSWDDLRVVIDALHTSTGSASTAASSRYDFISISMKEKNALNDLGEDYFHEMIEQFEPHFGRINDFLMNPLNHEVAGMYFEIIDDMRLKIATDRQQFGGFEQIIMRFGELAAESYPDRLRGRMQTLRGLLSFMYVNCDIGKKTR